MSSLALLAVVRGSSMEPTLLDGDIVLALRTRRPPSPGEIVVAEVGERRVIKRVALIDEATKSCLLGVEQPWGWIPSTAIRQRVVAIWRTGARLT